MKGYKITDAERKTRMGIAVNNFEELKKKTIDKFKLDLKPDDIYFQMQDGTVIECDEYFQTLPAQTLLVWVRKGEKALTDAQILYKTIREVNEEYLKAGEKVQEFFTEKMKSKVLKLAEVLKGIDGDKAKLSTREEHPDWFEGLDTNSKTKEEFMFRRAQDRIRTYYYKTKEDLMNSPINKECDITNQKLIQKLLLELQSILKLNKYHGYLFDRRVSTSSINRDKYMNSLCTPSGEFVCQGRWNKNGCLYSPTHTINPYTSREERIIFSTWNLDHTKERSRSVVPAIIRALQECSLDSDNCSIDIKSIYNDLFTTNNLKLAHIVCHDKGAHVSKKAGPYIM